MEKLKALFNLFRKGAAVANPSAWKSGQITATVLGAALIALIQLLGVFGVSIPMDADTATAIAGGVVAGVNFVLTLITSKHAGLPGIAPHGGDAGVRPVDEPGGDPVPSPQRSAENAPQGRSGPPVAPSVQRVDDATRARAEAWLAQQRQYERAGG